MKKYILLLAISLALSCAHKKAVEAPPPPSARPPAPPIESEPAVVEPEAVAPVTEQPADEVLSYALDELNAHGYLKHVYFDFDRYEIKTEYRDALEENARFLSRNPTVKILIEGHCDERGTREYNIALGERRAAAVKEYLCALGITPERIETLSYGKEKPLALCHDESCWWQNRRAYFVITAK